ncbi:UDP-N-acetylmuramoyl-tripeptide--D-alanyl-D-alanine ligase [Aquabacterium sp.]|uniref:UDP-N-acetylmuramoyl-tripeptide--D-alanyl-D- alanine ligase n=1 Tax=Aquabacterium sp. TaxID=1872578 RepID=UPI002CA44537|nr:UDP-N-acetylmuramoyl-tripeptide--D-alanyl-D-alanine ligase [Aquabacterium sp.]HSW04309.1 UDP-N-acetylmuramoyl-tripeptide--D-alanyl-D-alanine ligase [Aquabacterium sp.]
MMMMLAQAHALLPGAVLVGEGAAPIERVHTDTRTLRAGDLFVALRGERFDAHDFLPQARAAGAVAAIAERGLAEAGLAGLIVPDALAALQQLATAWRARHALPLIVVGGSNGKTTVTQMLASVLRAWLGDAGLATSGNLNNHIGVPLTVLRLRPAHQAAVVELGMNHPGEMALLSRIAQPTVALVNNAQREHQEFMASVEAVALENGAAIEALPADGIAVFPADDAQAPIWHHQAGARAQLTFALHGEADVVDEAVWVEDHWVLRVRTPAGQAEFMLYAAGQHNVRNALAATTAALAAGAPLAAILRGLEAFRPVAGRSQVTRTMLGGQAVTLVNDSYNANPDSVRAAIDLLASLPGPHWLVLGDMGEVGNQGPAFHAEVGAHARERGIQTFWCAGALCADAAAAFGPAARHFHRVEDLLTELSKAPACAAVLVKGSRFMAMERVVQALQARPTGDSHAA